MVQVVVDGQQRMIEGRVAGIIARLIERADLINQDVNVHVEFNCRGRTIKPVINIYEDEVTVVD